MDFIKRHVKLLLFLLAFLTASTWYVVKRENNYFTHVNRVTKRFIREMEKEHGYTCFSVGGSFPNNIKEISVKFYCYEKKSIEEARKLEVECVERFCEIINSYKKIRPYLEEFPFPSEKVGVVICFCQKDLTRFSPEESISLITNCREKLYYTIIFNDQRPNQTILEEPYSEAYEKVKGSVR